MTCFINLDYKYVHISFIASVHGFGPCVSFGQEESFPKLFKKSKHPRGGQLRFLTPGEPGSQEPTATIAPCCHKVSLLKLALTDHLLPQRMGALHGVGASLLLLLLSHLSRVRLCATPRLPRPWDSPGKNTGVGYHFLLQYMKVKSENEVTQSRPTPVTPRTAAHQAPPSMGFSRQEYWSGVPLPSPRAL